MSVIDDALDANERYVATFAGARPGRPRLRLAVLTCMDARLDLLGALGLEIGDAHMIRNAGGIPTDDALRSVAISQRALGTREIMVIQHTECGMDGFDDGAFRAALAQETGHEPPWDVPGFTDLHQDVRRYLRTVRACPWLPHRDAVRGFVYNVASATLTEVT